MKRGSDGQVRSAVVRTKDGTLTRPAVKLALLDVRTIDDQDIEERAPVLHGKENVAYRS